MAGFSFNPLAALSGVSQAMTTMDNAQEDRAYTRQARTQSLQSGALQNQEAQLKLQEQQRAIADQDSVRKAARDALTPYQTAGGPDANQSNAGANLGGLAVAANAPSSSGSSLNTGLQPGKSLSGLSSASGMSVSKLADLDQKNGLPVGTMYGLMNAESGGNPAAVSKKGAMGLFQVMPDTAKQPGYGLQAFDPKDPDGAAAYFGAMYKKAGGDMSKALAYWNAGPNGNPNNPETKAFVPRVMSGAKDFQSQYGAQQSQDQPTPAQAVAAQQAAGATVTLPQMTAAAGAQQRQIDFLTRQAQNLEKEGKGDLATPIYAQVEKLQQQQATLQSTQLKTQQTANKTLTDAVGRVTDQSSYNGVMAMARENPAMAVAAQGLGLTGNYDLDRNKLETLRSRAMTLKEQGDLQIKQAELKIKQDAEQRAEQKAQEPLRRQAEASAQDTNREASARQAGVPFVPSPLAQGGDPVATRQAQVATDKSNIKQLAADNSSRAAARQVVDIGKQMQGLLTKGTQTGGMLESLAGSGDANSQGFVNKLAFTRLSSDQQTFAKLGNNLVSFMQQQLRQNGGGVSSQTAAMYKNILTQKPELTKDPVTNQRILNEITIGAADTQNMLSFKDEYAKANPHADRNDATALWENYRQAVPLTTVNPANGATMPNPEADPSNSKYVDYHDWFRNNYYSKAQNGG